MIATKRCVLFLLLICQTTQAADSPFVSYSFDQAQEKAKEDGKLIFIDFYTTWCAPCKIMDKTTFTDDAVIQWLKENTIALKVDAEKEVKLASTFAINSYPTLLFAKADGSELGRLTGMHESAEFLAEAAAIRAGKTPLVRAKEKLLAAGENNPSARMTYAESLIQAGMHKEALAELLWCFDKGNEHSTGFGGVRLSYLLSDIAGLGQTYPPAMDALRQRRDTARERIINEEPKKPSIRSSLSSTSARTSYPVLDFASLNESLGEEDETLKLYDKMRADHPDWPAVKMLRTRAFGQILKAKRYAEIVESEDLEQKIEKTIARNKHIQKSLPEKMREDLQEYMRESLIEEIAQYYEALLGVGKTEAAARLAKLAVDTDPSASTYNLLAWHAYLSGKSTEVNISQARKAYELSKGENASIIDTLARVLDVHKQTSEACELLKKTTGSFAKGRNLDTLTKCAADLQCQPID